MAWNYRVCKTEKTVCEDIGPVCSYAIHEVYYNKDGSIWAITENPVTVVADRFISDSTETEEWALGEMERTVQYFARAVRENVIDLDTFVPSPRDTDEVEEIEYDD
jgi:hypothetical protein